MSIELRNRVKVLEQRIAVLEARDASPVDLSAIEARLEALENKPKRGRPPKND